MEQVEVAILEVARARQRLAAFRTRIAGMKDAGIQQVAEDERDVLWTAPGGQATSAGRKPSGSEA